MPGGHFGLAGARALGQRRDQSAGGRQNVAKRAGIDVVTDLSCRDEQVERTSQAIADGKQLGVSIGVQV